MIEVLASDAPSGRGRSTRRSLNVPFALKLRFGQGLDCIILTNEALVKLVLRSTFVCSSKCLVEELHPGVLQIQETLAVAHGHLLHRDACTVRLAEPSTRNGKRIPQSLKKKECRSACLHGDDLLDVLSSEN